MIAYIDPASGLNTGPVSITDLSGTNFQSGATVTLSRTGYPNISATDVDVPSDTQITCTLPITGAAAGDWTVWVRNPDGLYGTLTDGFLVTDLNPTITSITPSSGLNTGPVSITDLAGTKFQAGATVTLVRPGYPNISATDVDVLSDIQITCTFPITGAAVGAWTVWVENPDGRTGTLTDGFTVTDLSPTISSITPASGLNTSSVSITDLSGTYFQAGATVLLTRAGYANITATDVIVVSDTQITCTFPITGAVAGAWTVRVENPDGLFGTLPDGFLVSDGSPAISSITPASGLNTGPVSITDLAGINFQAGATVTLSRTGYSDILATDIIVVSDTQITCTLPITGAAVGAWTVRVENPDGEIWNAAGRIHHY